MVKRNLVGGVVGLASSLVTTVVLAQASAPTTATALAQSVDMSDAKAAGLIVAGLLIAAGVVLWGARLVMSKFQPKV
jgi:hypothetical protein